MQLQVKKEMMAPSIKQKNKRIRLIPPPTEDSGLIVVLYYCTSVVELPSFFALQTTPPHALLSRDGNEISTVLPLLVHNPCIYRRFVSRVTVTPPIQIK